MLSRLLLPVFFFLRPSQGAVGSLNFDDCDSTQQRRIADGIKDAMEMASASVQSTPQFESAPYYEFFGVVHRYGGRDPSEIPSVILNMFSSVVLDKFEIRAFCPGTGDQAMKKLCSKNNTDVHFGDIVGFRDGAAPGIRLVFCDTYFNLPSLNERVEFVAKELMWW